MRFALVEGNKAEALPGSKGVCPNCQGDTLAKCGEVKIWHWAHKAKESCDSWWENETAWHRVWKSCFPSEWQESIHFDLTSGEKHIADVKTSDGLVIEFQHSAIHPDEIRAREAFYGMMVWVVDGNRLKRTYSKFCTSIDSLLPIERYGPMLKGFYFLNFPEEYFPAGWLSSSVPVYFDFDLSQPDSFDEKRKPLWCLFPRLASGRTVVAMVSRSQFVELASSKPQNLFLRELLDYIEELATQPKPQSPIWPPRRVTRNFRRF